MAYLLLIPIALYVALLTNTLQRQPRTLSSTVLAFYLGAAALASSALLIVNTTPHHATADFFAGLAGILTSWFYWLFLPLTLVGLYFHAWLRQRARRLVPALLGAMAITGGLATLIFSLMSDNPLALAIETEHGFWPAWWELRSDWSVLAIGGLTVFALLPTALVIGIGVRSGRMPLWNVGLPLLLASTVTLLTTLAAPLTGRWTVLSVGFSYLLVVLLLTRIIFRAAPELPLESLLYSMIDRHSEGAFVVDDQQRVIWHDPQIGRWLGDASLPVGMMAPDVRDFLQNTPLCNTVVALLESDETAGECTVSDDEDGERALRVERSPLQGLVGGPAAHLIVLHDITATRMRQDLNERRQEVLALSAVSAEIASALDVDEVIQRALGQIISMTHLDAAAVALVDPATPDELQIAGSTGLPVASAQENGWLRYDNNPMSEALETGSPVIVPDASTDSVYGDWLRQVGLQAGVTVPLIARDRTTGVLQVGCREPHAFEPLTLALIESVGRQVAVAIENARLHAEERAQRLLAETLREVAGLLTTDDIDRALQQVLSLLRRVLVFDCASVMLAADPGRLQVRAHTGFLDVEDGAPLPDPIVEIGRYPNLQKLFTDRTPLLVADTTINESWVWRDGDRPRGSWIGVPLVARDQVLGCISISHHQPGHFTEEDLQAAIAFAGQAVVAAENHRLIAGEHRRRVQAEMLLKTSHELIMSATLEQAMATALEHLKTVMDFDRAHIALLENDGRAWTPRASLPTPDYLPENRTLLLSDFPLVEQIVESKRPQLIADTREHPDWRPGRFSPREIRSWIGVPLLVRNNVIGLLNVDCFEPHRFSSDQFQIAQVFANQIAATIEIFRLLEAASRQNRAMQALNAILSASNEALTQENLMGVLLIRVLEVLNLKAGAIHRRDPHQGDLVLEAATGLPPEALKQIQRIPVAETLPPVSLPDDFEMAFTSVPLISHGAEIGLLSLCHEPDAPFSPTFSRLLPQIGQQLGVVMENANLFEDALRREALSTNLGRLSLAISAQLDRETVLDLICRESIAVFEAHGAYIWLIESGELVGTAANGPAEDWFIGHRIDLRDTEQLPARVLHRWQAEYANFVADSHVLDNEFLQMTQARSVIAVPLLKADIPIGTLLLVNTVNPQAFAGWQTEQIGLLGVQAALAIQNATLFDEIRHRLDQLRLVNEVGRYATAILSPQSLIEGVADKLSDILHYDLVGLMLIEDDDLSVHSIFVRDELLDSSDEDALRATMQSVGLQAVRQAEPILQNQSHERGPLSRTRSPAPYCALATPLIAADEVIGVLVVERRGFNSIVQEDLDVMEPLAAQLAISVANARLFEKVRQQTIELEGRVMERTAEIRRQQERTEAIIGSVADAVIVFDLDGQVMMMNPVARTLFAQHDLEMDLSGRISALVTRSLADDNSSQATVTEVIEMGEVALQAKAARVVDGERVLGSVAVLRDISQLKELDRLKDEFVSRVSHELRTPLANIRLYLDLLQRGRPERRQDYLQVMDRETLRLERLIKDLLDLSRVQSEQRAEKPRRREPINLHETIETVLQDNRAWAERQQTELVHEAVDVPLPWIMGDPDQIVRALTNLVANALNYTPEKGKVTVRTRAEGPEQAPAEWVIIEVADTGIGIPEADLPNIFERFYRGANVDPSSPGTGLGLAIIKEIVELHGGAIEVESQEGVGSTFRLRLPAITSRGGTV